MKRENYYSCKPSFIMTTALTFVFMVLSFCSCHKDKPAASTDGRDSVQSTNLQTEKQDTSSTMQDEAAPDRPDAKGQPADSTKATKGKITKEMAYEGVNNYCHSEYDWSIAEGDGKGQAPNPSIMYVEMGEETASEYHVIFRSYTGAFVHFYVDKTSGKIRMVEEVPSLGVENEAGTIDLFDYIKK